jgi:hypothetical protein
MTDATVEAHGAGDARSAEANADSERVQPQGTDLLPAVPMKDAIEAEIVTPLVGPYEETRPYTDDWEAIFAEVDIELARQLHETRLRATYGAVIEAQSCTALVVQREVNHFGSSSEERRSDRQSGAVNVRRRRPRPPVMLRPSFVSQETSFAILGLPPRKFLDLLVPRCRDGVVRMGRTVLLPIDAAEAGLQSLTTEATEAGHVTDEEDGEQPATIDAVLASVNMERTRAR